MALVRGLGFFRAVLAVRSAVGEAVDGAAAGVHEDARMRNDLRLLRRRDRDLDYVDTEERGAGVLVRLFTGGASGKLFRLAHERRAGDIDVNVVLVFRVDDQSVRVRAAAGLHRRNLPGIFDIGDVKDAHATEALFLRWRSGPLD